MDMIPVVDLTESDKLRKQLSEHPLFKRRGAIEWAFLDELTKLTRKYGLEIKADTRTEYGETYPDHTLTVPYEGTEGRYVFDTFGVTFSAVTGKNLLACSTEERKQYEAAKAARTEEDKIINDLQRKISDAHWGAIEKGQNEMYERMAAQHKKVPKTRTCSCGKKFKNAKALGSHVGKTGHRNPL